MAQRPRVVIVGGGFGGLAAAKALRRVPVDVVLVDRTNHHLFQPLLYQVATARAGARRHRGADPPDPARAEEHDGAAGRGDRRRLAAPGCSASGSPSGATCSWLRLPGARDRRHPELLRARRVRAASPRA